MRHRVSGRRLGRGPSHQKAMFRSLASSMIIHEHLETTDARAKELRGVVDRLVTLGKKGDLASRRRALAFLRDKDTVAKLFAEVAPKYTERKGGYTRIMKTGIRRSFIDQAISQYSFEYIESLRNYKRILKQRNALFKTDYSTKEKRY